MHQIGLIPAEIKQNKHQQQDGMSVSGRASSQYILRYLHAK